MQKILTFIIVAFFLISSHNAKAITLSSNAEVSILTCGPSDLIHAIYGHTAIRVNDPLRRIDLVFNYGVFSFNAPNFVYRFAKGQTDYMLAPEYYTDFYNDYKRNGRSIFEQVLDLSSKEKQQLLNFLIENAKPENREYRYNFFFDNCATRVRDVIENHVDGIVVFPSENGLDKTFRQHVNAYQKILLWTNFGIHLTLGSPSDGVASAYEEMFLPDFLMKHFGEAQIQSGDDSRPLVKESRSILSIEETKRTSYFFLSPGVVLTLLLIFVVYLSVLQYKKNKINFLADYFLLFITGIIGILLLWFVAQSEHPAMKQNYNLLWAIPINIIFMFAWMIKKWRTVLKWYWPVLSVWLILFLALNFFIPQSFHIGFILISFMLLTRSIFQTFRIYQINNH